MAQIIPFPGGTILPIPVEGVLEAAKQCEAVLVLGVDAEGAFYAAASISDGHTLLWWLEQFRHKLMHGDYTDG